MPFVRAAGLTVHYELSGAREPQTVLLANSLGTNFHVWDAQMPALTGRFRVLRYDMRGHGLTDCPPVPDGAPGYTVEQLADDALALMDALEIDRAHVVGLSIGGMVAQLLAAGAPARVVSLVLCDTANRIGPPQLWDDRAAAVRKGGVGSIAPAVLARWFTPRFHAERPEALAGYANMLARTPADGYIGCCLALKRADLAAADARIACPTLVVVGEADAATPPEAARALAAAIKGARLEVLKDAAHIPCVERPEAFNRLLLDFLSAR